VVEVNKGVGRPQSVAKIIARHYLSRTLQQQGQNLQGLLLQLHLDPVTPQLSCAQVNLKGSEAASS